MSNFNQIEQKLQAFSKKYYTNELIKGSILFVCIGLLYLFFTLFIEYFLWLQPNLRTLLFWVFILVEVGLLIRFVLFPIFKLFGLRKGISYVESSKIIGNHFPEVKDKLLNILQLKTSSVNSNSSELLLASIEQKANELQPIPFVKAINFSVNIKYLKYLAIPLFIWIITLLTGVSDKLSQSFNRVVNHSVAYQPPAPFYFNLTNKNLEVIQGNPLTIYVETKGNVIPEDAKIHFNNQEYYLDNNGAGLFSYTFDKIDSDTDFYVKANNITSNEHRINIVKTPSIQNISIKINYPSYLKKSSKTLPNATNITVPEGTRVTWLVSTTETESVTYEQDSIQNNFKKEDDNTFSYQKKIKQNTDYQISTSNKKLKNYEKLQFAINTIQDEKPSISVKTNIDSVSRGPVYFAGQITDDYGISKLEMVYYNIKSPKNQLIKPIKTNKEAFQSFFTKFPGDLQLEQGVDYEMYFRVFDNDAVNGRKEATSRKFSYRKKTDEELENELLREQENHLNNLQNSLENQKDNKKELEKIQSDLQHKKNMNWNDQKKIQKLVERQEQYKQMMQRQTKNLQENFSEKKEENEDLQKKKENIQKRIEELKKLDKQQKLLDELKKMAEKLNKEDLIKKTKELAQQNKQQEKSLERVLELAKRYYVQQKMNQVAEKLQDLAKKQEELSKKESTKEEQNKIQKEFDKVKEDLKNLKKENEKLKDPMDIPENKDLQKKTDNDLNKAKENIEKQQSQEAKKNQKKAAKKMQQMSQKMQQSMQMMSSEMEEENMEDLRSIVENLITFSFDQENLMDDFSNTTSSHPSFGKNLRKQYQLKTYFEHIDDSLFVLSMRVPDISSDIQDHLANAHYNLDQSLENFTESRFRNGISNQRYVMTSANELADMLSNTLDAMQNPNPSSGQGKGGKGKDSFSLPDIIQKQEDLMKQMQKGMQQKGKEGDPKDGKNGKKGEQKGEESGKNGQNGQNGKDGEQKNEDLNGELYKIYKEQSELRQQLEDAINKNGKEGNGQAKKALKEMEQLENEILEKGFTQGTLQRMQRLNYELLKLDKATFQQGRDKKRKSTSNLIQYNKNRAEEIKFKKQFYNQTEILNRQSLPLKQQYKKKVQEYFKRNN
ncbi:DUF4175 family protein [Tenacibaculum sp. M341]|uniref:DUF4175 family protein n=1 Tax=Tenacibaculum sp. M341 TaxID=2530339 RepID=UPI001050ACEB|nr:DUF4175 family protein [Tenacibaculum sp. M341]TCI92122.1 DUF4175 family protein [Tenacibaculum sp. M341]